MTCLESGELELSFSEDFPMDFIQEGKLGHYQLQKLSESSMKIQTDLVFQIVRMKGMNYWNKIQRKALVFIS